MLKRLQKSMDEKDQGFTLIELLVVVVIIGILAAIAIPLFLSQREKAAEASLKSDLKNVATAAETYYVDEQDYTDFAPDEASYDSETNTLEFTGDTDSFCIDGSTSGSADAEWKYDSVAGGLKEGTCA